MKFCLLLIITFILTEAFIAQDKLYINDEYHFRIKFPNGWKVYDGEIEQIKTIKVAEYKNAKIAVAFQKITESENINHIREKNPDLSDQEIEKSLKTINFQSKTFKEIIEIIDNSIKVMIPKSKKIKIIKKGISYLDNWKFAYAKYTIEDEYSPKYSSIFYSTYRNGIMYAITGSTLEEKFDYFEQIFISSISTFAFEDSLIEKSSIKEQEIINKKNNYKKEKNLNLISLIVFFALTLNISVLFRFVLLEKSFSKRKSLILTLGLTTIGTIFLLDLIQKNTAYMLLIICISGMNYFILRYESKTKANNQE